MQLELEKILQTGISHEKFIEKYQSKQEKAEIQHTPAHFPLSSFLSTDKTFHVEEIKTISYLTPKYEFFPIKVYTDKQNFTILLKN